MLSIKLAFRNLVGAGKRAWLNIIVLSIVYVMIIFMVGMIKGVFGGIEHDTQVMEYGNGQYWSEDYDPHDPINLRDYHQSYTQYKAYFTPDVAAPILITPATVYTEGRSSGALLKGIVPEQTVMQMPTEKLLTKSNYIPAMIGKQMAKHANLAEGDIITLQVRDKKGVFDAVDAEVVYIMQHDIQTVDNGQIWIPLDELQDLLGMKNEATLITVSEDFDHQISGWEFKDLDFLLADIRLLTFQKSTGAAIMYVMMLGMAAMSIFDTQMLAVFRRKKEIGTLIALGMTQRHVKALFTIEGIYYAILGIAIGLVYGIPLLLYTSIKGINYGSFAEDMGVNLGSIIYPEVSLSLIINVTIVVAVIIMVVSYLPARSISKLNPTQVLKGK
ncbi:MAG: ABC transporter permease [Candidatus Marinimicrobia bacterium]|nr:ABC transporter permease [Candidatus Neomarinimicrobiota bacterium]